MSIGASIPIPFDYLRTTDSKKAEHLALAKATEYQKSAVLDDIGREIEQSLAAWQRAVSQEKNYRETLVPSAHNTLEAALLAYETDRTNFFSIYRSELDLIQLERAIRSARITTRQMKAKIETLIGEDMETVRKSDGNRGEP
jgi:outer membrane protein TolC